MSHYRSRRQRLVAQYRSTDTILLTRPGDLRYFTGNRANEHDREAYLLCSKNAAILLHSPLITPATDAGIVLLPFAKGVWQEVSARLTNQSGQGKKKPRLLFDADDITVAELSMLQERLPVQCQRADRGCIDQLRAVKDEGEVGLLRRAAELTLQAQLRWQAELQPGVSERAAARRFTTILAECGSEDVAFPAIVAFGDHTAQPHHLPTDRILEKEMPVLIDCGGRVAGYCADLTRTFWFGARPPAEFTKVERIVRTAYDAVLEHLAQHPTVASTEVPSGAALDAAARQSIAAEGYGHNFIHTTGHGVGLDIHEQPAIAPKSEEQIIPSMVITVEPGIYLPGTFGYRHENTILVTDSGPLELTV